MSRATRELGAHLRHRNLRILETGCQVLLIIMPVFTLMDYLTLAEKWGVAVRNQYVIVDGAMMAVFAVLAAMNYRAKSVTKKYHILLVLILGYTLILSQVYLISLSHNEPYILLVEIFITGALFHFRPLGSLLYLVTCVVLSFIPVIASDYTFLAIVPPVIAVATAVLVVAFFRDKLVQSALEIRKKNSALAIRTRELELSRLKAEKSRLVAEEQRRKSDDLLLNILPAKVAEELKQKGFVEPMLYESASILFTDFKGFTGQAMRLSPGELVHELDALFLQFDQICERNNLEKLKTIGDSYMCAGGLPEPDRSHAVNACLAALEIQDFIEGIKAIKQSLSSTTWWEMRLGIHSGPVMAGVIGQKKFAYDVWGDTVNVASRMETGGQTGRVNISEKTFEMVKDFFECQYRGLIQAKNHGELGMYFLVGIRPELSQDDQGRVPNEDFRKKVQTLGQLN
ncbi:MAG: adenylate/guanylate cyclase domain-containing protein [Leptospiraceae bacterium]|nr:adenylate/guanylate cyclase domain-containing protein [Leptospiraceae bacterium]